MIYTEAELDYRGDSFKVNVSIYENIILSILEEKNIKSKSVLKVLLFLIKERISFNLGELPNIPHNDEKSFLDRLETTVANTFRERLAIAINSVVISMPQSIFFEWILRLIHIIPFVIGFSLVPVYSSSIPIFTKIYIFTLGVTASITIEATLNNQVESWQTSRIRKLEINIGEQNEENYKKEIHNIEFFALYQEAVQIKITKQE